MSNEFNPNDREQVGYIVKRLIGLVELVEDSKQLKMVLGEIYDDVIFVLNCAQTIAEQRHDVLFNATMRKPSATIN